MDLRQSETWRRHQLAAVERMQADVARYTHPVMRAVSLSGVTYLAAWAAILTLWQDGGTPATVALAAGLSAAVVLLGSPAFALAAGLEWYFRRRLKRI